MTLRINLKWTVFAIYLLMIPFTASYFVQRRAMPFEKYWQVRDEDGDRYEQFRSNYCIELGVSTAAVSLAWPLYWSYRASSLIWEENENLADSA